MFRVRRTLFAALFLCGLAFLQTGCRGPCTEMYVPSGFTLRVTTPEGVPVSQFAGTASWNGHSQSFECSDAGGGLSNQYRCHENSVFIITNDPPREVDVTIDELPDGTSFQGRVSLPELKVTEPNGPGCGETKTTSANIVMT